jgi:regulator of protease activity HflC (stomatin/prohibitin superfamily)
VLLLVLSAHTGLYWYPVFGRVVQTIPTCVQTLDIKKATVVDRNGNPIVVAGVVTFQVIDSVKAAFGTLTHTLVRMHATQRTLECGLCGLCG